VKTFTIDYAQIIWIIMAVVIAVSGAVNPWLVLLLATMDIHVAATYKRRR
jgi:hypothetical protein